MSKEERLAHGMRIPIINLYSNLIVPIQGMLPDFVMTQLQDDVARRIVSDGAEGLIIDVSGVSVMDSYVTRVVRDLALTAKLMGVRTVLSGIQATVAMTLVEMGLDIPGIKTTLNLERALEYLDEQAMAENDDPLGERRNPRGDADVFR
ncbi:MAG: STAS domain-containing protein [Polyangiaceae bacterium]